MAPEEITEKARELVAQCGGQVKASELLGVSQPSISKALTGHPRYEGTRYTILRKLGGYKVEPGIARVTPPEPTKKKDRKHSASSPS